MPPLPADSIHARACKLKCEKILTRPAPSKGLHPLRGWLTPLTPPAPKIGTPALRLSPFRGPDNRTPTL